MANIKIETGKAKIKTEYNQFKILRDALRTYYNALTNPQKQAVLNTFQNWGSATAVQKADALIAGLALSYLALGYLLWRELGD